MTVQYNQLVLTGGPGVFLRLLMRAFEQLVVFINNFQNMIPVAFILGFYIQLIYSRFWYQFMIIPWILKLSMALVAHLPGSTERPRLLRRTCVRYLLGSLIMSCTRMNVVAKKRFPTMDSFIDAGIFTEEEIRILEAMQIHIQPFAPIVWATSLITMAAKENYISNQHSLIFIMTEVNNFRESLLKMFFMDYICVPLVYTQVVTLSVYSYFIASLFGRQYIVNSSPLAQANNTRDFYFPFFTLLEFIIYVGWLKVAETLINPMGEDDEDFDINEVIDFNWEIGFCIVDGMRPGPPAIVRDAHWHQSVVELPHTIESRKLTVQPCRGSMFDIHIQSTPDYLGSMLSMPGGRRSQDLTGRMGHLKRVSMAGTLNRTTSQDLTDAADHAATIDDPDHQGFTLNVPQRLGPYTEEDDERGTFATSPGDGGGLVSPFFPSTTMLAAKGYAETIEEENEEELKAYSDSPTASNPTLKMTQAVVERDDRAKSDSHVPEFVTVIGSTARGSMETDTPELELSDS